MAENDIRNIGLFGHAGSGKTTIADGLLYLAGANTRFGKVNEQTPNPKNRRRYAASTSGSHRSNTKMFSSI
jgi:translation elongation factor EF-G